MKKLLILVFAAILLTQITLAYQEKMTVKECLFSYDDPSFQNYWSEENQTGIFLNITNTNLVLGKDSNPVWVKTVYTPVRKYYNNFEVTDKDSTIPMLQVMPDKGNIIYSKCRFKVGNYRVFFADYYPLYAYGTNQGLKMTYDFNLTQGLIDENSNYYGKSNGNIYTLYSGIYSPISYSVDRYQYEMYNSVYYIDNKVDSVSENLQINPNSWGLLSTLQTRGFYPNTEPVVGVKMNLTKFASGTLDWSSVIRENGYQHFFDPYTNFIYLNSSTQNIVDMLGPYHEAVMISKDDSEQTLELLAGEQCNRGESAAASKKCVLISSGDRLKINFTIKNIFNTNLNDVRVRFGYYADTQWGGGAGYQSASPGNVEVGGFTDRIIETVDFAPGETREFVYEKTVPSDKAMYYVLTVVDFWRENPYSNGKTSINTIGSDNVTYLGFMRYDPRIELVRQGEVFNPVFRLIADLYVFDNWASAESIKPGDYSILAELINSSGVVVGSQSKVLDEAEFAKMSPAASGDFITNAPIYKSAGGEDFGYTRTYEIIFPILPEYYKNSRGVLVTQMYSVMNTGNFSGKKIAKLISVPNFEPGDILYSSNNVIHFGNDSKIGRESVYVFNPSFFETSVELRINWSDTENYTLKWADGSVFEKNPVKIVGLRPFQESQISFDINATMEPWVSYIKLDGVDIIANASLKSSESASAPKTARVSFLLNVTPYDLMNFNLKPGDSIIPNDTVSLIINENGVSAIKFANWSVVGSQKVFSQYSGKEYSVRLSLKNQSGYIFNLTSQNFTIRALGEMKTMGISYNYTRGEYYILLELDTRNDIAETGNGESDNSKSYDVRAINEYCYYNATENTINYYDFFGVLHRDSGCNNCQCPGSLSCEQGVCKDDNNAGCANILRLGYCNNGALHQFRCGWNCGGLSSPAGYSCPPESSASGVCKRCVEISDSCAGYNNKETCDIDPCGKSSHDCGYSAGCECYWASDTNKCSFKTEGCTYTWTPLRECTEGLSFKILNFTGVPAESCPPRTENFPCNTAVGLGFTSLSGILVFAALFLIFYISRKKFN